MAGDEALDFLERQPRPFRFVIRATDKPNAGGWRGLENAGGYLASVSRELYDYFGRDWRGAELAMNTVYEIAREPFDERQELLFASAAGWNVYCNPGAGRRAWIEPPECHKTVEYRRIHLQRVEIDTDQRCAGALVIADPYFPGWRARVDGAAVEIMPHEGALMRLNLPPGRHRVTLFYLPAAVLAGAAITALAMLLCAAAAIRLARYARR